LRKSSYKGSEVAAAKFTGGGVLILCDYLVGTGGNNRPAIILDGKAGYIGDDLVVGRADLITIVGRNDLILELHEEDDDRKIPVEWLRLVGVDDCVSELLLTGDVVTVIDGTRVIGIANPVFGVELDNGVVKYA
jgi:hypothetical protein